MNYKLKLRFKDRMGIVADISTTLAGSGFNIISMDVDRKEDEAHVYTEIENITKKIDKEALSHIFDEIQSFMEFQFIDILPQEEKANRFRVVLDNMSDGVVSIDKDGNITTINQVASAIFMQTPESLVGKHIKSLDLSHYEILESLKGKKVNNAKQNLITDSGRYQYISTCKPIRDSSGRIIGAVEIAREMHEIRKLARSISQEMEGISFGDIIGNTEAIKEAIAFAQKIAATDVTVAIHGASGTGKELFASAIHTESNRKGPYIPINCAALPEQLLESELFGYVGGAFTGGKKEGKAGLFETANQGTVFLDEIAEMPMGSQAKLLRLLQEKAVRRIGGTREIPVNARIITATNKNLDQLVKQNKFREDLYYRINVLPIHIPPLKHRKEDIPLLLEHFFFRLFMRLGKKVPPLTPYALEKLVQHDWPGNVRELKNVIERAAFISRGTTIDKDAILFSHELSNHHENIVHSQNRTIEPIKEQVAELEKRIIVDALKNLKTVRKSALALGISHPALLKKMKKYDIKMDVLITTGN
ncbi:PAS modulated sigma54 specific transcriptional regulator, Fis family [Desulfamplus magnetovallimortis]|uniref:HTH-type transcriptional regulatory protein TyrR n=1 Tax=Desulfamplus magnetovallimortis TaxID=1246637 RepID=A0A1W1HJ50_9BACT|nr:sigma 54-interacting transcriptional regulator [Desulfamplus magnetovallimortis]SLM32484.1 PAS modulated sigma54 specific transcriptional regulator, Fis family [Desulfamplus magnetovallimortis]